MKRKIICLPLVFLFLTVLSSCGQGSTDKASLVTPEELNQKKDEIVLIDVRTPQEYEQGHIENAVNINIAGESFQEEIGKLDKEEPVYVYCKVGGRSGKAAKMLKDMGFKEVYDLEGGIVNWEKSGMETVK